MKECASQGNIYRYFSFNEQDRCDLEKFATWAAADPPQKETLLNYLNLIGHKKNHRLVYLLTNKKLYRTTPSGFNDPYDCLVEFDPKVKDTDLLKWFRLYHGNQAFDSEEWQNCRGKLGGRAEEYLTNNNSIDPEHRQPIIDLLKFTLQKLVNRSRVVCFSEKGNNLLMWAHYAGKHEGYCLKFCSEILKSKNKLIGFYPIEYSDSRPLINLSGNEINNMKLAQKILLSKSNHWKYEEEVRLIWNNREEYFDFQVESLTGIVFGAKMPLECQKGFQFLVETLNESDTGIKIECAELDPRKYEVNLRAFNKESS